MCVCVCVFFSKIFSDFYRDLVKVEIENHTKTVSGPVVIVRNTSEELGVNL